MLKLYDSSVQKNIQSKATNLHVVAKLRCSRPHDMLARDAMCCACADFITIFITLNYFHILLNFYLFSGGSTEGELSFSGTHWSHLHTLIFTPVSFPLHPQAHGPSSLRLIFRVGGLNLWLSDYKLASLTIRPLSLKYTDWVKIYLNYKLVGAKVI